MTAPTGPRLRVIHVAQSVAGGVASFLEEIAADQARAFGASHVAFVVPAGSEGHLPSVDPAQVVPFAATARTARDLAAFAREALAAIARFDPDVVHLHSTFAGAALRPLLRRRAGRPAIVYCPHGWAFGMETTAARRRAYALVERALAPRTDLIIVNSETERRLALRHGLPAERLRTVPNGIAVAPEPDWAGRAARTGPLEVAFVGRHDRQKGLDLLLDAVDRTPLPHIRLHVVGDAVLGDGAALEATPRDGVVRHGWLGRAEVVALLDRMDAVVMPSRWEAAGLVALEAMRAGVAVLASDRGALPEVVAHGNAGLVFSLDDPDALGRSLRGLDRAATLRLGREGHARWRAAYTADRMNAATRLCYAEALAGRPVRVGGHAAPAALRPRT